MITDAQIEEFAAELQGMLEGKDFEIESLTIDYVTKAWEGKIFIQFVVKEAKDG